MKPSIGRIVHYQAEAPGGGLKPLAAIVTEVHDNESVSLCVFRKASSFFVEMCIHSEEPHRSCWNWAPRVE